MKWKTVEIITLVTRLFGVLFIIYSTLGFGVLEKYNLQGIGNNSAYALYWRCLIISCVVFVLDFVIQIFKLVAYSHDIDPHSYDVDPLEEGMAFKEQSLFACKQAVIQLYKGITFSFS